LAKDFGIPPSEVDDLDEYTVQGFLELHRQFNRKGEEDQRLAEWRAKHGV
jgi:hypothetical protein